MPSEPGSPEPQPEFTADMVRETVAHMQSQYYAQRAEHFDQVGGLPQPAHLTTHLPLTPENRARIFEMQAEDEVRKLGPMPQHLTTEEQDRISDGEPYCFRCGKPASSFAEYREGAREGHLDSARDYVCDQEGTYNDITNRFACDSCYIAIGMPVGKPGDAYGWRAP